MTYDDRELTEPDYAYWVKMASWSIDECALLLNGLDPDEMTLEDPDFSLSSLAYSFSKTRELVLRAAQSETIPDPITPASLIEWCQDRNIQIPKNLQAAYLDSVIHKKGRNESLEAYKVQNLELTKENQRLKTALGKLDQAKPIGEREKDTLSKIMVGLALMSKKYHPKKQRNDLSGILERDLIDMSIPVSQETITKKIKEAFELADPDLSKKTFS